MDSGALAKWLEKEGFKFGIYSDSGTLHCGGGGPGGLGHEMIDAQTYADWGVSFLKYDNCNVPADICHEPIIRYTAMSKVWCSSLSISEPSLATNNMSCANHSVHGHVQGLVRVFLTGIYTRGWHWFPRLLASTARSKASRRLPNGIPLGFPLFLPIHTVNYVQTLKALNATGKHIFFSMCEWGAVLFPP
jgi:hypothetical protein